MSKAAELANLIGNINAGGGGVNRNAIINGSMNVAQRATSSTGIGASSGYFVCDRWRFSKGGDASAGRFTMTQDSSAPEGFANSMKLDCTTADTSIAAGEFLLIGQRIEGQNMQTFAKGTSSAKPFAVSFYVKGNASATYVCELVDQDNSRQISKTFNVTTDWARIELSFPADTTGTLDDDNAKSFELFFWLHAGSTYNSGTLNSSSWASLTNANRAVGGSSFFDSTDRTFFLTGVQLEVGQNPTEFEHEKFSQTLERCSRYYQKTKAASDTYKHFGLWFCAADTGGGGTGYGTVAVPLVTTMRTIPSLETTGTVSNYAIVAKNTNYALTTFSVDTGIDDGTINGQFYLNAYSGGGMGAGTAGAVRANNTADAFVALDAEL